MRLNPFTRNSAAKGPADDFKKEFEAIGKIADPAARLEAYKSFQEKVKTAGIEGSPRRALLRNTGMDGFLACWPGKLWGWSLAGSLRWHYSVLRRLV